MQSLEILTSIALGVGLAAAVGLRVFLPLLVLAIAGYAGVVPLADSFQWLASLPAVATLGVAAAVEIAAYYIPGVDNLLDTLATPAALIAGTIAAAAVMTDLPPIVKWTTAVIAGGGAAGLTQGVTSLLRVKSTATTGGLGNPLVATGELGGATALSLVAIFAPIIALALVVLTVWLAVKGLRRLFAPRRPAATPDP
ncbi:MAG: DUF4126 domain-containing protein [Steroidobacteraceae bacterium]|nr:DUF4126 domain-containing protein [Nevskiaceae bacterium]MCP5339284.1 DUF4126 domain-containing protein [Nevskiaceae bacterium]MCP5359366.1 DUF4126 domain-containing protein [Nevskiaceae bacterium]MCP5470804.1 DUF4126 domain-containing protein [Nevskiaceae bacterium]